jgi:hypothetical protein
MKNPIENTVGPDGGPTPSEEATTWSIADPSNTIEPLIYLARNTSDEWPPGLFEALLAEALCYDEL